MSATELVPIFQITIELETGITSPLGKVHIIPAPIVAGKVTLLKKFVGAVGAVPQAIAVVTVPTGSPVSSCKTVIGLVGVTPIAAGLPNPKVLAVAFTIEIPISKIFGLSVEAVLISKAAVPAVPLVVLFANE